MRQVFEYPSQDQHVTQAQQIHQRNQRNSNQHSLSNHQNSNSTGNNSLEDETQGRKTANIKVLSNSQIRKSQLKIPVDPQPNFFANNVFPKKQSQERQGQEQKRRDSLSNLPMKSSSRDKHDPVKISLERYSKEQKEQEINLPLQRQRGKSFKIVPQPQERVEHRQRSRSRLNTQASIKVNSEVSGSDLTNKSRNNEIGMLQDQRSQALRKFKSGDSIPYFPQQHNQANLQDLNGARNSQKQVEQIVDGNQKGKKVIVENIDLDNENLLGNSQQNRILQKYQRILEPKAIEQILFLNSHNNLTFNRFKLAVIEPPFHQTNGADSQKLQFQLMKLEKGKDQIRDLIQQPYLRALRRQKRKAQRKESVPNEFNQMHQIQPSHMLQKEIIDPKFRNLKIESTTPGLQVLDQRFAQAYQNNAYMYEDQEDMHRVSDGNDRYANFDEQVNTEYEECQVLDSNRTFEQSYGLNRSNVVFQNEDFTTYQSPACKQSKFLPQSQVSQANAAYEDQMMIETQRILNDSNSTNNNSKMLQTPSQKAQLLGNSLMDKAKEIYRAAEYSDNQKKQMEKSIINRSTIKKIRRQKFVGTVTIKLEKKNLESFRENLQIKEEQNLSDEEENDIANTPSAAEQKSLSMGESKLIKNPTYARITHASKQMEFLGQQRPGGMTVGFKSNQQNYQTQNPLLKSMPNLDQLKLQELNMLVQYPFEERNERLQQSELQHSNTFIDISQKNVDFRKNTVTQTKYSKINNKVQEIHSPGIRAPSSKLFEEFFIIGVEQADLTKVEWSKSQVQFVEPRTLYMYSEASDDSCDRRRVVKDFCFPDGVEVRKIKSRAEGFSASQKSIYSKIFYQSKNLREQCFIFTLNANDEGLSDNNSLTKSRSSNQFNENLDTFPEGGSQDKYYNCLCVVLNELVHDPTFNSKTDLNEAQLEKGYVQSSIYGAKRAYCFMFSNHYYQFHLEVISALISLRKSSFIQNSNSILSPKTQATLKGYPNEKQLYIELVKDVFANLQTQLVTSEMQTLIDKCFEADLESFSETIKIKYSQSFSAISYELPSIEDTPFLEHYWFCPQLFQLFSSSQLLQLVSAILLEKSIIFVGKAHLISSTILGLNCLLYPFKWCFAIVPVLPHPLIDMIEAPVPILVGITKREYRELKLSQEEKALKTWVNVETGHIIWSHDYDPLASTIYFDDLLGEVNESYSSFSQAEFREVKEGDFSLSKDTSYEYTVESARSSLVQDQSQLYTDSQRDQCRDICITIRKSIKRHILEGLKSIRKNTLKVDNLVEHAGQVVVQNCQNERDTKFLQSFVQTQMFSAYVEELF